MNPGEPEQIILFRDAAIGLEAALVLDHSGLGPAAGGIRTRAYSSLEDLLADAKNLARAMTLKCALAGLSAGGGKMVVRVVPGFDRRAVFARLGDESQRLGGRFRTAGDLGTTAEDLEEVAGRSEYVHTQTGSLAGAVARGHLRCVEAGCGVVQGASLEGISAAIQGCGDIGQAVIRTLSGRGASLSVADLNPARVEAVRDLAGVSEVAPEGILHAEVDVLAPCAVGGVVSDDIVDQLRAPLICGAANNILSERSVGERLAQRGIKVVPDIIASAGGVVEGIGKTVMGLEDRGFLIDQLGETAREVLDEASRGGRSTQEVAEQLAVRRILRGI
ncbi:MAG: Glu/Leu/Phe/Val dehydrogenase dimerization domain-containing protein [Myxococcota bacterium]|nr:Glu/Leu/Phe/Val dehydrogenase dimerization domain-containing protein [Myxococcota bacterium]